MRDQVPEKLTEADKSLRNELKCHVSGAHAFRLIYRPVEIC